MTLYDKLGGEQGVRQLVDSFYYIMDTDPLAVRIRNLHPADLAGSREKLFFYLSGWLGGPELYIQKYGHPRLRARHLPFSIGELERDEWMRCMIQALHALPVEPVVRRQLGNAFYQIADLMRNKQDELPDYQFKD